MHFKTEGYRILFLFLFLPGFAHPLNCVRMRAEEMSRHANATAQNFDVTANFNCRLQTEIDVASIA